MTKTKPPLPDLAAIPRTCDMCQAFAPDPIRPDQQQDDGPRRGTCRLKPPHLQFFVIPPGVVGGNPRDVNLSGWPIVMDDQFCIEGFMARPETQQ